MSPPKQMQLLIRQIIPESAELAPKIPVFQSNLVFNRLWSPITDQKLPWVALTCSFVGTTASRLTSVFKGTGISRWVIIMAGFPGTSVVNNPSANACLMQETRVQSLGWKDPLEKEMATHSSILA